MAFNVCVKFFFWCRLMFLLIWGFMRRQILANGWTKPDPVQATKEVIAPLVFGLMSMIVVPGAVFRAANYLLPSVKMDDRAPC